MQLLRQYPDISINMMISLSRHLRHFTTVIEELSFKDVPQRLATYLLKLSNTNADTSVVTLDLSKSQLAGFLGTIPSTLSRSFYHLCSEGIIAMQGAQIHILDRGRLTLLSQKAQSIDG